jgi:hypothetical protein
MRRRRELVRAHTITPDKIDDDYLLKGGHVTSRTTFLVVFTIQRDTGTHCIIFIEEVAR